MTSWMMFCPRDALHASPFQVWAARASFFGLTVLASCSGPDFARAATTSRPSVISAGVQVHRASVAGTIGRGGRLAGFTSPAIDRLPGDANRVRDTFVQDLQPGSVERVSRRSDGGETNGPSEAPGISAFGRGVALRSAASSLVAGDASGVTDAFLRDRGTGVRSGPPAPPATCTATDDIGCEVLVTWSASAGATAYRVYRDGSQVGDVTGTSFSDLAPPGAYEFCVTAYNMDGESAPVCDNGQALSPPSYDPSTGHYYEVVPGQVATWTTARDAAAARRLRGVQGHLVTITSPEEQAFVRSIPGGTLGLFLGAFQPPGSPEPGGGWMWVTGESFSYQNWAPGEPNNQSGTGPEGFLSSIPATGRWNDVKHDNINDGYMIEYEPPFLLPAPADVQASDGTNCSVRITWLEVSGAVGYHIFRDGVLLATLPAGATSHVDTDTPPLRHEYCVEAFGACGGSPRSCETGSSTPPPPASVSASDGTRCVVDLNWTPVAAANGYFVHRDGVLLRALAPATTAIQDTILPGTYQYAVSGFNPCGESERTTDPGTSTPAPPFDPAGGNYYELVLSSGTWDAARVVADAQALVGVRGHLVTITDEPEHYFVATLVGERHTWIGAFQPPGTGEPRDGWEWVTGEPWSYTRWLPGEPNELAAEEDCGRYKNLFGLQGWNDERCFIPSDAFVVEYDYRAPLAGPQALFTLGAFSRVTLQWPALTGPNIQGTRVYRDGTLIATLSRTRLTYVDQPIVGTYTYCVRTYNRCGAESQAACATGTGIEPPPPPPGGGGTTPPEPHRPFLTDEIVPAPNPGRDFTLRIGLARGGWGRITVHDAAGREVARLADRYFPPGASRLDWDGRLRSGERARPGLYLVRMRIGDEQRVQRLVVLDR